MIIGCSKVKNFNNIHVYFAPSIRKKKIIPFTLHDSYKVYDYSKSQCDFINSMPVGNNTNGHWSPKSAYDYFMQICRNESIAVDTTKFAVDNDYVIGNKKYVRYYPIHGNYRYEDKTGVYRIGDASILSNIGICNKNDVYVYDDYHRMFTGAHTTGNIKNMDGNGENMLLLCDSFSIPIIPLFATCFSEIDFVDNRYNYDLSHINVNSYDKVLVIFVKEACSKHVLNTMNQLFS